MNHICFISRRGIQKRTSRKLTRLHLKEKLWDGDGRDSGGGSCEPLQDAMNWNQSEIAKNQNLASEKALREIEKREKELRGKDSRFFRGGEKKGFHLKVRQV